MDHVLEGMRTYFEVYMGDLVAEMKTKQYTRYTQCPSYPSCKALADSMNILRMYLGWDKISIKEELEWRI